MLRKIINKYSNPSRNSSAKVPSMISFHLSPSIKRNSSPPPQNKWSKNFQFSKMSNLEKTSPIIFIHQKNPKKRLFFTFFALVWNPKDDRFPSPPPPPPSQTRRKNLVSRRDVVTVDEDRDPERRGDKEEIGTACTRSRKMINETGRTMEGWSPRFLLFFRHRVFESFHAISTNGHSVGERREQQVVS